MIPEQTGPRPYLSYLGSQNHGMETVIRAEPGDVVCVRSVKGGYPLPYGLAEQLEVRLVRWDGPYAVVEREEREWMVFLANVHARELHRRPGTPAPIRSLSNNSLPPPRRAGVHSPNAFSRVN